MIAGLDVPICRTCGGWGRLTTSWFRGKANTRKCPCCQGRRRRHCADARTVFVDPAWAADAVATATKHTGFVSATRRFRNPSTADLGQALVQCRVLGSKLPPPKFVVLQELLYELTRDLTFLGELDRLVQRPPTRETVAFAQWWDANRIPRGGTEHVR